MTQRPSLRFALAHPAHWIALGFGSGLSRWAPGTAGSAWAWAVYLLAQRGLGEATWLAVLPAVLGLSTLLGWWACTQTARHLGVADPSAIVWDEVIAVWLILWWLAPLSLGAQALAFALFRAFDAIKRGPVGWADAAFKLRPGEAIGWRQGFGILFDDFVAAGCTVAVFAAGRGILAA